VVATQGLVCVECQEENRPLSGQQHQAQFGINPALRRTPPVKMATPPPLPKWGWCITNGDSHLVCTQV